MEGPAWFFWRRELGASGSVLARLPSPPGHSARLPLFSHLCPGLVQRCVIIQKDQHGFGFTVSGDRVVLVQSVRPGESRARRAHLWPAPHPGGLGSPRA